jgi:sarcosine oxidase
VIICVNLWLKKLIPVRTKYHGRHMSRKFDVIVVGVGAMGAAACFQIARRGKKVLGLEQFDIPHNLGSSHGQSRIIRAAYYEHPDYVPLLLRAYELWDEIETIAGEKLLHMTGGVYAGPRGCELVNASALSARKHGLEHAILDASEIRRRFPQFVVPDTFEGLWEPQAGVLRPENAVAAYARAAVQHGAEIVTRRPVRSWSATASEAVVQTDADEYRADEIVFCAGPWTGKILGDLGAYLRVTRQPLLWLSPPDPGAFTGDRMPVWAIDRPAGGIYYGFPILPGDAGLKAACHDALQTTDPDHVDRALHPEDRREVEEAVAQYLPTAQGPLVASAICLYTNSPDSHFILGRHPRLPRVTLAAGFSGHGFKFASVVGEILADLSTAGTTARPISFLSPSRFHSAKGDW